MAVTDIYVLPSNYPKFDWADWPESAASLVPDGYTHEFEKEAWNAIVDLLAGALADAGEVWANTYTTAAGARITEEYGDLRAAAINSVRHNIDTAVPVLRWGWANDPTFRGYIGRKDFRGVDAYGEAGADDVYPEYIVELASRLNFMLSVLTGEATKALQVEEMVDALHSAELLAQPPYVLAGSEKSYSIHKASGLARSSRLLSAEQIIKSKYEAPLRRSIAARMGHKYLFRSNYEGRMAKLLVQRLGGHRHNLISKYLAGMDIYNARPISAKQRSWSLSDGELVKFLPKLLTSYSAGSTLHTAAIVHPLGLTIYSAGKSTSGHSADVSSIESYPVTAQCKAATLATANPDTLGIAPMGAKEKVTAIHAAALKKAVQLEANQANSGTIVAAVLYLKPPGPIWIDPVQTGSNLYISSVWFSWNDGSELQIDTPEFYVPIRDGSNLHIRSVRSSYQDQSEVNIDTEFFLRPVQEGSNLYIRQDIFGGD